MGFRGFLFGSVVFAGCLFARGAFANCVAPESIYPDGASAVREVRIEKSFAPVFDGDGMPQPGCIVQSGGKILGYTSYGYVCRLAPDETILVKLFAGCCDTGPDSGDLACTVRSKNFFGLDGMHGNGMSVVPASKDARALDDMIETLGGDFIFSYYGAATAFIKYLDDPAFRPVALAKKPAVEAVFNKATHVMQQGMTAYLLLHMDEPDEARRAAYVLRVLESEPVFIDVVKPVLEQAKMLQGQVDVLVPALVRYLRRRYYDAQQAPLVFEALESFGKALRPQMAELLEFEKEWSFSGSYNDFPERETYWKRMNALVCAVSEKDVKAMKRKYEAYGAHENVSRFRCGQ